MEKEEIGVQASTSVVTSTLSRLALSWEVRSMERASTNRSSDRKAALTCFSLNSLLVRYFFLRCLKIDNGCYVDGTLVWAVSGGGKGGDDHGMAVKIDTEDNILVTGTFSGTAVFGSTKLRSNGGADIFVAKYNPEGAVLWVHSGGGSGDDEAHGIALYADGSCLVAGAFQGTAEFGGVSLTAGHGTDILLIKYDPGKMSCIHSKRTYPEPRFQWHARSVV